MKLISGSSENYKVNYNPRTVPKPPEELQRLVYLFIEIYKISTNALDTSDPSSTACALLDFMDRGKISLPKYVAQLINIVHSHVLFHHEVFKTELFLNYRETMGTFCKKV